MRAPLVAIANNLHICGLNLNEVIPDASTFDIIGLSLAKETNKWVWGKMTRGRSEQKERLSWL